MFFFCWIPYSSTMVNILLSCFLRIGIYIYIYMFLSYPSTAHKIQHQQLIKNWLVVWNINFIFPYIGNNHPNWRTHIFQRGSNHQPEKLHVNFGLSHGLPHGVAEVPKLHIRRVGAHEAHSAVRAQELGDGSVECREAARGPMFAESWNYIYIHIHIYIYEGFLK